MTFFIVSVGRFGFLRMEWNCGMRGGLSRQDTVEYWSYQFEPGGLYQSPVQYENKMFFCEPVTTGSMFN